MQDKQQNPIPQKQPEDQKTSSPAPSGQSNLPAQEGKPEETPKAPPVQPLQKTPPERVQAQPPLPGKEKLEFLKRMDVRTMAKDIARLREQEAAKERRHIEELASQTKQAQENEIADSLLSGDHEGIPQRTIPKAPSRLDKLFVRILIILVLLFVLGNLAAFTYYYWFVAPR